MKKWLGIFIIGLALLFILISINKDKEPPPFIFEQKKEPLLEYGFPLDSFFVVKGTVKRDQTLGEILYENHVDHPEIYNIAQKSKDIFDVRRISKDRPYMVMCSKDSTAKAQILVYEEDAVNYIVFDLRKKIEIYRGKKEVSVKLKTASSVINSSLSLTMQKEKLSPRLTNELSNIYAWTIDFFKIQKGDAFKIYYEDRYINKTEYIGIGKILASEFTHKGQKFYAFHYRKNDGFRDYYDEEGKTLRKAFLMAPVDYKRISSRFSNNRKHPVTGQWKGHFGTDYAAEKGEPIWSTANGTVIAATYNRNNGHYVKIKHTGAYTTQYLHMSKIKPGIRKGVYVKQGETIGYVGSTGLATGPHVCYRFWKDGRQVDPFKEKLPPGEPIKKENKDSYMLAKDSLMKILMN